MQDINIYFFKLVVNFWISRFDGTHYSPFLTSVMAFFCCNLIGFRKTNELLMKRERRHAFLVQNILALATIGSTLVWVWYQVCNDPNYVYDRRMPSYDNFNLWLWSIMTALIISCFASLFLEAWHHLKLFLSHLHSAATGIDTFPKQFGKCCGLTD